VRVVAADGAGQTLDGHQAFDRAPAGRGALTVQLFPHLASPIDAVVLAMDSADFDHQFLVADHPSTRRALRRGVVISGRSGSRARTARDRSARPELTTHNSRHQVVTMTSRRALRHPGKRMARGFRVSLAL
jgi:hypothetical protein